MNASTLAGLAAEFSTAVKAAWTFFSPCVEHAANLTHLVISRAAPAKPITTPLSKLVNKVIHRLAHRILHKFDRTQSAALAFFKAFCNTLNKLLPEEKSCGERQLPNFLINFFARRCKPLAERLSAVVNNVIHRVTHRIGG